LGSLYGAIPSCYPRSLHMRLRMLVIIGIGFGCLAAQAQDENDRLVRLLVNDKTQAKTVADIVASGHDKMSLLLSWTKNPPGRLDPFELETLKVGLADIFGQLKTNEAVPFLVKNIRMQRSIFLMPGFGLKEGRVVLERLPAVAALVKISTPALESLERALYVAPPSENRLPFAFAITHTSELDEPARPRKRTCLGLPPFYFG